MAIPIIFSWRVAEMFYVTLVEDKRGECLDWIAENKETAIKILQSTGHSKKEVAGYKYKEVPLFSHVDAAEMTDIS